MSSFKIKIQGIKPRCFSPLGLAVANRLLYASKLRFAKLEGAAGFLGGDTWHNGVVKLKDLMGRTVLMSALDLESNNLELDLTGLNAGIYICELLVDNKPIFAEKYVLIK